VAFALLGALVGVGLGVLATLFGPSTAEASFFIRNPNAFSGDATFQQDEAERQVADQIQILRSPVVLSRAANSLRAATGKSMSIREFDRALSITWSRDSSVATALFSQASDAAAIAGITALLDAYQGVLTEQFTSGGEAALELTNQAIEDKELEISSLEAQLAEAVSQETPATARLNSLASQAAAISDQIAGVSNAGAEALLNQLNAIRVEMDLLRALVEVVPEQPTIVHLQRRLDQAVGQQDALLSRRTNLELETRLNQAPVVVFSEARVQEVPPLSLPLRYGLAAALLAFMIAAARAYFRAIKSDRIESIDYPEVLIGAPLLAEITDFESEGLKTQLPVRDDPRSMAAESFRFLAAATDIKLAGLRPRSIAVVGSASDGHTATAANLGLAMAKQGARVLLLDADFGNQSLSAMFGLNSLRINGIAELINGQIRVHEAGSRIAGVEGDVTVIGRGRGAATAPAVLRTPSAAAVFASLGDHFDIVIVDTPPLLSVAYATTLVSHVGASLVVIPLGARVDDIVAIAARLRGIGSKIIGYTVHGIKPVRGKRASEGSLNDVLSASDAQAAVQKTPTRA
jgi:Mrp family chromosome partitioning ATPase